jgi:hypothetical protein
MRRSYRLALIAVGIVLFLAISFALARFLAVENQERDADLALLQAEARGDAAGMLAVLHGCGPGCRATVAVDAAKLRGPGEVSILADMSATAYALTGRTGKTRIAWKLPGKLPTVQCLIVRRTGNAITGVTVKVQTIGAPIPLQSDCS